MLIPVPKVLQPTVQRAFDALLSGLERLQIVGNFVGTPSDGQVPTYNATLRQWEPKTPTGGGGGGDHGALTGLGDDDHPQYHNDARGDLRYWKLADLVDGAAVVTVPAAAYQHEETVAATGITAAMRVVAGIAPHADSDENSEDMLSLSGLSATPGTNQITFKLEFAELTSGPIRLNYIGL